MTNLTADQAALLAVSALEPVLQDRRQAACAVACTLRGLPIYASVSPLVDVVVGGGEKARVSWKAIGSVSVEEASAMAKDLTEASLLATRLEAVLSALSALGINEEMEPAMAESVAQAAMDLVPR